MTLGGTLIIWTLLAFPLGMLLGRFLRDTAPDGQLGEDGPVNRSSLVIQTPVPHGIAGEVFQPRLASDGADHTT